MKRFWILFVTEFKAWRHDPISILGGFIASGILLLVFGTVFGGRMAFKVAVLNYDTGLKGVMLGEMFDTVISPFGTPYYEIIDLTENEAWRAYDANQIEAVWVIPNDFSARIDAGLNPKIEMHFSNYNDDRAKNNRLYAAEILWRFYKEIDLPGPPLEAAEVYPRSEMIHWFPIIGVGVALLSTTLGGMFNIFMLTYKEHIAKITLEFGLAPRSLTWVLLPKTLLALVMGLVTGTCLLGILYLWEGVWPGWYLGAVWLLAGLVTLFWIAIALLLGLFARHILAGPVAAILSGIIAFFIGGGLASTRYYSEKVLMIARLFPNTYAVDPMRDLILFHAWPVDWTATLLRLTGFAILAVVVGFALASRQLRRLG